MTPTQRATCALDFLPCPISAHSILRPYHTASTPPGPGPAILLSHSSSKGYPKQINDVSTVSHTDTHLHRTRQLIAGLIRDSLLRITHPAIITDALSFSGQWTVEGDASSGRNGSFHLSTHIGDQANLIFTGSGISISGFRNASSGRYNVTLDDSTTTFDGTSAQEEPTMLFFQSSLDLSRTHNLTIVNAGNSLLAVGVINILSTPNTSTSPSSLSRSAIIGITITSVLVFLLFVALAVFLYIRRRERDTTARSRCQTWVRLGHCTFPPARARDAESFDGQSLRFAPALGEEKIVLDITAPAPLPHPLREHAMPQEQQRQEDRYTVSPRCTSRSSVREQRRNSRSALLGGSIDGAPYLTLNFRSSSLYGTHAPPTPPPALQEFVTSPENGGSGAHVYSFLELSSTGSNSVRRQNSATPSSRLGDSPRTPTFPLPTATDTTPPLARAPTLQRTRSGSSPSFPYPFATSPSVGGVPPSPSRSVPASVSDIHFRQPDEMSESDGYHTNRPPSIPHPPLRVSVAQYASPASPVVLDRLFRPGSAGAQGFLEAPSPRNGPAGPRSRPVL